MKLQRSRYRPRRLTSNVATGTAIAWCGRDGDGSHQGRRVRSQRDCHHRSAERRHADEQPLTPASDTKGLRHDHADANGERKEEQSRQTAEQGWRARRSGDRATSDTIVASHTIGERKSDNDLSASNERSSSGKRRRRSLLKLTCRSSPSTTSQSRPSLAEQGQRDPRRRLGLLAGGSRKTARQRGSRHPAEDREYGQVEREAPRAEDAAPECAPLVPEDQRCPSQPKSPVSGLPA